MSSELPVVFAGGVARGELRWLYEHASAFATASLDEGFGLPLIEAEHFGLPRIASDIPVFHEIAGEGTTFFDPRDVRAITDALDRMIVRVSRDEGARERAVRDVERFSWDRTVARLSELAAAAVDERRRT
jgi:glycosyltransferase involved in cell wall biosynthesis